MRLNLKRSIYDKCRFAGGETRASTVCTVAPGHMPQSSRTVHALQKEQRNPWICLPPRKQGRLISWHLLLPNRAPANSLYPFLTIPPDGRRMKRVVTFLGIRRLANLRL